ncbi:MAG: ABC transporter permease, partial [Proteobacteria bacterium ST_bin15]
MNLLPSSASLIEKAARATPPSFVGKVRGLSDKAIAWIFIAPTLLLLLAINIFPLIWTIQLSFTNYRANRPNAPLRDVGLAHYNEILTNPDIWAAMQVTAR